MVELSDWDGLVHDRGDPEDGLVLDMPLTQSTDGGSGSFKGLCSDEQVWWVKPSNHLQNGKVLVTEYVVGRVGALVGAPVCKVEVVRLPAETAGWEFRPGRYLEEGFGSASMDVPDATEFKGSLRFRERDDNRVHHVGCAAIFDWCWGGDPQYLYCSTQDQRLFSHDHGWYFPDEGNEWGVATLAQRVDAERELPDDFAGVDEGEVERLAVALEAVTRDNLSEILMGVPASWPVSDEELCALGYFLERRAPRVAERLRRRLEAS